MLSGHIARSLRGEIEDGTVQLPFRTGSRCGRQRIVHLHERFVPEERILRHFALEQSRSDGIHRDVVRCKIVKDIVKAFEKEEAKAQEKTQKRAVRRTSR